MKKLNTILEEYLSTIPKTGQPVKLGEYPPKELNKKILEKFNQLTADIKGLKNLNMPPKPHNEEIFSKIIRFTDELQNLSGRQLFQSRYDKEIQSKIIQSNNNLFKKLRDRRIQNFVIIRILLIILLTLILIAFFIGHFRIQSGDLFGIILTLISTILPFFLNLKLISKRWEEELLIKSILELQKGMAPNEMAKFVESLKNSKIFRK